MSETTRSVDIIHAPAIRSLLANLPRSVLSSASPTHLPTTLPLTFPTPLHTLNFLVTLHLVHTVLTSPIHAAYFAETSTSPGDTALRGIIGLFLASDESWGDDNLLSASAWNTSKLDEVKVSEVFGIQVVREKTHETISAIRVGERWPPAVGVAGALVELFRKAGERLSGNGKKCVGEVFAETVKETYGKGNPDLMKFTKLLMEGTVGDHPSLGTEFKETPDGALPPGTLRLLQDLAYRQSTSHDLDLDLPQPADLAQMTALPISIPVLLQLGILDLPSSATASAESGSKDASTSSREIRTILPSPEIDLLSLASEASSSRKSRSDERSRKPKVIKLPIDALTRLQLGSTQAGEATWRAAGETTTKDDGGSEGEGDLAKWKKDLTFFDICRIFNRLEEVMIAQGLDVRLVPM